VDAVHVELVDAIALADEFHVAESVDGLRVDPVGAIGVALVDVLRAELADALHAEPVDALRVEPAVAHRAEPVDVLRVEPADVPSVPVAVSLDAQLPCFPFEACFAFRPAGWHD
jgi:hypothetical protein